MSKSTLVTGGHGFIGRNVSKYLANEGFLVNALGHGQWENNGWRHWGIANWSSDDVTHESLAPFSKLKPAVIVHCAGSSSVGFSVTNPREDFQRSVDTTINVLDFARRHAPMARILVLSSASVYGESERLPIAETDRLMPISAYGLHKKIVEEICEHYAFQLGLRISVLRLFSVYGAGLRKQLLWDACCKATCGDLTFFGTGNELRDWIHVHDVASLIGLVASSSSPYEVLNGASGTGTKVAEIVKMLLCELEVDQEPVFTGIHRPGDPMGYVADIGKALAMGWQPRMDLREGINDFVRWYLSQRD